MNQQLSQHPRGARIVTPKGGASDALGFFESIKLNDLENGWLRLSAAVQRYHFDAAPFGKKAIRVNSCGLVEVHKTQAFGGDFDIFRVRWSQAERAFVWACDGERAAYPIEA